MKAHFSPESSRMKRAALYACYSGDLQSASSIEEQLALCRMFCVREGFVIVSERCDRAFSATSTSIRDGIVALLSDVTTMDIDLVVVESMNRLSRDRREFANISDRIRSAGAQLLAVQA